MSGSLSPCHPVTLSPCHLPTTEELFAQGDYASVARNGEESQWQTHAARGLIGKTREAVEGLSRFPHEEAAFYSAVARWIGGQDAEVPRLLERIATPHAQNLLALLRKPRINVLAQLPWRREGCSDLVSGAAADPRFHVRNISFEPQDLPLKPHADIHAYYAAGDKPDLYVCAMIEWHLVPPNLTELDCPLFGQTADYDLHIQTVYPWLKLFDAVLVTDPSEWRDVCRLVRAPVCTFPKSFGVPRDLPCLPQGERDLDVYLSGTTLHPYHPEKARLLHQLLEIHDLRIKVINGFKTAPQYYQDLARSKICISYVRHPTALPTRALEALAMGCAQVVQRDSVLTLFAGEQQGILTYELERNDLSAAVQRIAKGWPDFARRAEAGARLVREEFSLARVASQYLRFLTFLAARPRGPRSYRTPERLWQKRSVLLKGWLPSDDLTYSPVLREMAFDNSRRLQAAATPDAAAPHALLDLARESVLSTFHRLEGRLIPLAQWLTFLRDTYHAAQEHFPRSLVTRFNSIRVMLHLGTPDLVSEALSLLDETLRLPHDHWQVHVMEDVFPWDFFPQFFNYRAYFDHITGHLMHDKPVDSDLRRLILASLHAYRGFYPSRYDLYDRSLDHYQAAVALDPDFPYFKLWHAKQLLKRGQREDRLAAARLLRELADNSLMFQEAAKLLAEIDGAHSDLVRRAARSDAVLHVPESIDVPKLQPDRRQYERLLIDFEQEAAAWKDERQHLHRHIRAIESSKFWKLRQLWFRWKCRLRLTDR
jgi:tetratricopeptide (TPR) repeat protein